MRHRLTKRCFSKGLTLFGTLSQLYGNGLVIPGIATDYQKDDFWFGTFSQLYGNGLIIPGIATDFQMELPRASRLLSLTYVSSFLRPGI